MMFIDLETICDIYFIFIFPFILVYCSFSISWSCFFFFPIFVFLMTIYSFGIFLLNITILVLIKPKKEKKNRIENILHKSFLLLKPEIPLIFFFLVVVVVAFCNTSTFLIFLTEGPSRVYELCLCVSYYIFRFFSFLCLW